MRLRTITLCVFLAALLILPVVWFATRTMPSDLIMVPVSPTSAAPDLTSTAAAELVALRHELAQLRAGLDDLDGRMVSDDTGGVPGPAPGSTMLNPDRVTDASNTQPRGPDDSRREQIALLEDRIVRDEVDRSFEGTLIAELTESFLEQELEGIEIAQASCSQSMCRIDLDFEDALAVEVGMPEVPHMLSWASEGFVAVDEQDPSLVAIYAMRAGSALPVLE